MKNKALLKILSTILAVVMVLCSAPLSGFTGIELPDLFSVKAEAKEYIRRVHLLRCFATIFQRKLVIMPMSEKMTRNNFS